MGIDLVQYRICIGCFNRSRLICSHTKVVSGTVLLKLLFLFAIISLLIILSGDVEIDPGPNGKCKDLSICHVNIRSLSRSKLLAIQLSLANVYDIITISETHLHQGVGNDVFELKGYHDILRRDRGAQGGGIAIIIKENITFKRMYKYDKPDLEVMWVSINTIGGKILLCCCYRPPDQRDFWDKIDTCIEEVKNDHAGSIFILGDLNADFKTQNGKKLQNLCQQQNLSYLVSSPTRITNSTATVLDQILTNSINFVQEVNVTPPISSNDHCTISALLSFKIKKDLAYQRLMWDFKKADFSKFCSAVTEADFDKCFETDDIDEICKNWTDLFLTVAKSTIPNKFATVRPNDSPWYTNDLRILKRRMLRSFHKHKMSMSEDNWDKYVRDRNAYKTGLDNAEGSYKKSLTESLASNRNSKSWWLTVKWLLGKRGDSSYHYLNVDNQQVTESNKKAQAFNDFFLSHSNIDDKNARLPENCNYSGNGLDAVKASENEISDIIHSIDTSKATGPDGISPRLLREAGNSIVPSLTRLINLSLLQCKIPKQWKLVHVVPLFKKGDKHERNNYRPVSLLPCVSKILERIVFKYLFNYLRDNGLLSKDQSGFQPGDSTVNQLAFLYNFLCKSLDEKKDVHIVFCDISKAFDRVWHKGLIHKLKNIGITGSLLQWFIDYLHDRYQKVVISGQTSSEGLIKAGVPQGSVLGPLLFLIYINDLTLVTKSKMKLFADDTTLYVDFDDPNESTHILNQDLKAIQQWADKWLVTFSPPKTKLLSCSFKKKIYPDIIFNNVVLQNVNNHKHLGLTFSENLGWSAHVDMILDSVSPMSDVLKKLKYEVDRKSLEATYYSFIRPKLEYASFIWDNCCKMDKEKLEVFQLSIARTVTGARKGTSSEALYKETNWLPLSERRKYTKLKIFCNIVDGKCPAYLTELLPNKIKENRPNSRNAENFQILKCRTETYKSSFIPSTVNLWNSIPLNSRNKGHFTEKLKTSSNSLFYEGCRTNNIKHAQLRMKCSKLNQHLFLLHVSDTTKCLCGYEVEDNAHFFLYCPLYHIPRQKLFQSLESLNVDYSKNDRLLALLLEGDNNLDVNTNKVIFKSVHSFISETDGLQ